jgi:hypothetical protein
MPAIIFQSLRRAVPFRLRIEETSDPVLTLRRTGGFSLPHAVKAGRGQALMEASRQRLLPGVGSGRGSTPGAEPLILRAGRARSAVIF